MIIWGPDRAFNYSSKNLARSDAGARFQPRANFRSGSNPTHTEQSGTTRRITGTRLEPRAGTKKYWSHNNTSVKYKIRDQHGLNCLTCSIVGWVDLCSRQVCRDIVLDSWRYCQEHKGFQVHAYTIMSNHLHLIASCRAPHRLEAVMRDWKHFTAPPAFLTRNR